MRTAAILAGCAAILLYPAGADANPDPVQWAASVRERAADTVVVEVRATIARGWFIYGMHQPEDGPFPLLFRIAPADAAVLGPASGPAARVSYDRGFQARVGKYSRSVAFLIPLRPVDGAAVVPVRVRYQACNDEICLPPRTQTLAVSVLPHGAP